LLRAKQQPSKSSARRALRATKEVNQLCQTVTKCNHFWHFKEVEGSRAAVAVLTGTRRGSTCTPVQFVPERQMTQKPRTHIVPVRVHRASCIHSQESPLHPFCVHSHPELMVQLKR